MLASICKRLEINLNEYPLSLAPSGKGKGVRLWKVLGLNPSRGKIKKSNQTQKERKEKEKRGPTKQKIQLIVCLDIFPIFYFFFINIYFHFLFLKIENASNFHMKYILTLYPNI